MTEVYDLYDEYIYLNGHWERIGGGGDQIPIDDHLSNTSENPVQNKVITLAMDGYATQATLNTAIQNQAIVNEQLIELLSHAGIIDDNQVTTMSTFSSSKIMGIYGDISAVLDLLNGEIITTDDYLMYLGGELTANEINYLNSILGIQEDSGS